MTGVEWSEGCGSEGSTNCGDIGVAGPLTPKCTVGGITKRLVTTPKSKGKGKGKTREEDEEIEEPIEDSFTNKCLAALLHQQKVLMVVDMGMGARVVLEKAKGNEEEEKETEDVELKKTPLATIAEVEPTVSNGAVKAEEEVEAEAIDVDEDEDKESKNEEKIR
ncbi:hypothetical protein C0989_000484 [Termitomyces sp. Mn162]|nr:hypothetical protein C0989_000484 [Termitomyces sp. Mn162]